MSFLSRLFHGKSLKLPKIVVILGPTASGKTDLALALARKFDAEIINADSRQVYQEMNIGTAKPTGEWRALFASAPDMVYMVDGVPHHLMDIVSPDTEFTLADFKARAQVAVSTIRARGHLPIVVGGTGLYLSTLVDNWDIPAVAPNKTLRADLEKKSLSELVALFKQTDPESAAVVDLSNPRRVLRALEVALTSGQSFVKQKTHSRPLYDVLEIGIAMDREALYSRIDRRVDQQMTDGLLAETQKLAEQYSWELPSMSGIGYRQMGYFLHGESTLEQAIDILKRDTRHYAKRQMTWFKRDARIHWVTGSDTTDMLVKKFLQK